MFNFAVITMNPINKDKTKEKEENLKGCQAGNQSYIVPITDQLGALFQWEWSLWYLLPVTCAFFFEAAIQQT